MEYIHPEIHILAIGDTQNKGNDISWWCFFGITWVSVNAIITETSDMKEE
jgi:hypothetical protein